MGEWVCVEGVSEYWWCGCEVQAEELLELFGTSRSEKSEKGEDEVGGEWERVKVKSKGSGTRVHRPGPTKRSSSPNSMSGRRRAGPPVNGSSAGGNASQSSSHYSSSNGELGRGREGRGDTAQQWRSDSDSWSGSSSAGLSTSSWVSHEEERPRKGGKENGVSYGEANGVVRGGEYVDPGNASSVKSYEHSNGLCENGGERDCRGDSDDVSTECTGSRSSLGGESGVGSGSPNRGGFSSYSAALKAGMGGCGVDVGGGDIVEANGGVESEQGVRVAWSGNVGVPSSGNAGLVGDGSKGGSGKQLEAVGSRRLARNSESGGSAVSGSSYHGGDLVWQERKGVCWDGEGRKADGRAAWSDSRTGVGATMGGGEGGSRACEGDGGSVGGRVKEGGGDGRKSPTGGTCGEVSDGGGKGRGAGGGVENAGKKVAWQGNDAAAVVVGRPMGSSGSSGGSGSRMGVTSFGQQTQAYLDVSTSNPETSTSTSSKTSSGAEGTMQNGGQAGTAGNEGRQSSWQGEVRLEVASSASQTKGEDQQGPSSMGAKGGMEGRRGQQYNNVGKEREEKVHFRRAQTGSPEQGPGVIHQRGSGQSVMAARIATPPVQASHQQFHPGE